jgi:site-specific DNA recombinase
VRRIYQQYLAEDTPPHIARDLNAEKVARDIDLPWSGQCILHILCNEHYIGDCLLQKSFVTDTSKQARNKGQLDQFYVQNHHPAIINREVWDAVQRLREERRTMRYPFSRFETTIRCSDQ